MTAFPTPAWLVGCGNMAGAMVEGWRKGGIDLAGVTVIRPSATPVEGVRVVTAPPGDQSPRYVMLGVKPQKLDEVAPALAPHVGEGTLLVSMLAGVSGATLIDRFPNARAIVRVMPNLAVSQIQGVTALYRARGGDDDFDTVTRTMSWLGMVRECPDEDSFAAIGAVAGSGPAYIARFVAALAVGGEALGLRPRVAASVALQTLVGTGAIVAATSESMESLARRVASPNGTTEQGLAVLDASDGLQPLVDRMFAAAIARGKAMAAEAAARG